MSSVVTIAAVALALSASAAAAQGTTPTDAQIAAIVVTANQLDVDAAELAQSKAGDPKVKAFAQRMIVDHTGVNEAAARLARKLGLTPEPNATSTTVRRSGEQALQRLRALDGDAFDRAYIDHEVTYHQSVLKVLDETLIPSARHPELKGLLVQVRPAFADHLEHARQTRASLEKSRVVTISAMTYAPAVLRVTRGEAVTWRNEDPVPHTVTADDRAFDSGSIPAGDSWTFTAAKPGTFQYACTLHPTMKATLIVE
jgi:putative membrane protein